MAKSRNLLAKLPFAPTIGAMFAAVAAILVGATPYWLLSRTVAASGLPAIVPAFNAPLGDTARIALMIAAAIIMGMVSFAIALIADRALRKPKPRIRPRGMTMETVERTGSSVQTDGRSRPPLFADAELGAPLMSDEAYELARDELILDAPLAEADALPDADDETVADTLYEEQNVEGEAAPVALEEPADDPVLIAPEPALPQTPTVTVGEAGLPIAALIERLERGIASRPDGMPPLRTLARTRAAALLRG